MQAMQGVALSRSTTKMRRESLRRLLSGGDRRTLAQANRALERVRAEPRLVAELAGLTADRDWLVALRALDLLEKLAREHAEWIEPHKQAFIGALAESDKWEVRLQIVRALPLLAWAPSEERRAVQILLDNVEHPQKFVKAWLDSLAFFAERDTSLKSWVSGYLLQFERSGSKALEARARRIRERLGAAKKAKL